MALLLKNILRKNRYLKALYREFVGTQTITLDYPVEFKPRWTTTDGNEFLSDLIKEN